MISDVVWVAVISSLLSFAGSWLIAASAIKRAPVQIKKEQAETAGVYQKIANDAGDQLTRVYDQIDEMQDRFETLRQQYDGMQAKYDESRIKRDKQIKLLEGRVDELQCALEERDHLIEEWQAGISQLIGQIEENQLTPVWRPRPHHRKRGERGEA